MKKMRLYCRLLGMGLCCFVISAQALNDEQFAQCQSQWQERAGVQSLSEPIRTEIIPGLSWIPRVIELDRRQPEFTETFANYVEARVNQQRVQRGRQLLQQHRSLLNELTATYGIPGQYLIAFWGLETNFGGFMGKMSVLDSLATLACDRRRSDFFTAQLFDAFHLMQDQGLTPAAMQGSWAGAMGHMQFMPSNYRQFAIDGDGNGTIDLWRSIPDALTSAANFLHQLGWQSGLRWGREVRLPADFQYELAGIKQRQSLHNWRGLGVKTASGKALPVVEGIEAALLVPAGHAGPAFLVYHNFDVIMHWNRSEFYALAVGHLADRINGGGRLIQPPPDVPRFTVELVRELQSRLSERGYDPGPVDGILGPATRDAIRLFQRQAGLVPDGYPAPEVFEQLKIELERD